jgi:hypothetical protein
MFTMANIVPFHILFVCAFSPLRHQQWGEKWTPNMFCSWTILMSTDRLNLPAVDNHTHNNHKIASTIILTYYQKRIHFKPSSPTPAIMPLFLDVDVPNALEKRGFITAPSVTTAASTAKVYNFVSLYNLTQS